MKYQNEVVDVVLVFLLLTLKYFTTFSSVSIDFEQINVSWVTEQSAKSVQSWQHRHQPDVNSIVLVSLMLTYYITNVNNK